MSGEERAVRYAPRRHTIGNESGERPELEDVKSREYRGVAAKTAMMYRLARLPKAREVALEVADFYGDSLQYHEDHALTSSQYEISFQRDPIALRYVRVELQVGTARTSAALSHELLHLNIGMKGYPLRESVLVPPGLAPYAGHLLGIQSIVANLLEHELMFEAFLGLGFAAAIFLADLPPVPDYEELVAGVHLSRRYVEELGFPWWCSEYLRLWISARHGLGDISASLAEGALYWGSLLHPAMEDAVGEIRTLIEDGMMKVPDRHPASVNRIMELMRLPKYAEWVLVRSGDGGRPTTTIV